MALFAAVLYGMYRISIQDQPESFNNSDNVQALQKLKEKKSVEKKKLRRHGNKLVMGEAPEESKSSPTPVDFTEAFTKPKRRKAKIIRKKAKINQPVLVKSDKDLTGCTVYIFYLSLTGASERTAQYLYNTLSVREEIKHSPKLINMDNDIDDLDDYFLNVPENSSGALYVLVLPSYETDSPIDYFLQTLEENSADFRIDSYPLREKIVGYSVIGIGDKEHYPDKFCYQATLADKFLNDLGGTRIFPLGQFCIKNDGDAKIKDWCDLYVSSVAENETMILGADGEGDVEVSDGSDESGSTLVDIEEIGRQSEATVTETETKQMVAKDSPTYKSLTKQGYTVVGLHLGVKICRWTKSALRGRGSCYKFAFYGIRSHLCMETTPSLLCSNKCVFCWRHGTNPVGTSWRWQVDGPEEILKGALEGHYKKIKQMRGVPGVVAERFQEAFTVRHCALSLVGEPIFYPYINEFVGMLHDRHISSFLVCNAQHPEQLLNLKKVTQLYVSIDAPTKNDLKKVDRPLFRDFWERLNSCLDILNTVQAHQRTVFRLTLVKGFNMGEVKGYADLIERANPSLVEIKGATFCGSSAGNGNPLTMQNIPFYEECKNFVNALNAELAVRGLTYDIAAEHAHSCCILMAHMKYKIDGKWYTHINYPRFFELLETKGDDFNEMEYIAETPEWAYWGSDQAGFNPEDVKFNRKEEKLKRKAEREAMVTA